MPVHDQADFGPENLIAVLDQLPSAVTVTDLDGRMVYYNESATQLIDRKPEYLGRDVRGCHKLKSSSKRVDEIIEEFKAGNHEPVTYKAEVNGVPLSITVVPLIDHGKVAGLIHHVAKRG